MPISITLRDKWANSQLIEKATGMANCSRTVMVCYADGNWQIRLLRGSAKT